MYFSFLAGSFVTAMCIYMPRINLLYVEREGGFFHLHSRRSAGHDTCAIKTSKIELRREQGCEGVGLQGETYFLLNQLSVSFSQTKEAQLVTFSGFHWVL